MIPLFKVFMPESVMPELQKVLLSGYIGQGDKVDVFETLLSDWFKNKHTATLNSGTSALHLALRLAGVNYGDEVISTPLTCTATNWPILERGADITWADVNVDTCNIDLDDVESKITEKTKAVMVVHWGGNPVNIARLLEIKRKYNVEIIEDCAHAFGSEFNNIKVGAHGNFCAFSFQAIKHLTTIDGGCLTLPSAELFKQAKLLRWYGIDREAAKNEFRAEQPVEEYGYKFHMNDVNATIGIEQMKYVEGIIEKHRSNAEFYLDKLSKFTDVSLMEKENGANPSYWLFTIRVDRRKDFIKSMLDRGIQTHKVHERNDFHPCVKKYQSNLPGLNSICEEIVCLPVGWWVSEEDRNCVVESIMKGW